MKYLTVNTSGSCFNYHKFFILYFINLFEHRYGNEHVQVYVTKKVCNTKYTMFQLPLIRTFLFQKICLFTGSCEHVVALYQLKKF